MCKPGDHFIQIKIIGASGIPKEAWEYKLGNRSALE